MFLHVIPQRREKSASPSSGSHPYQEGGIFRFPVPASSTARVPRGPNLGRRSVAAAPPRGSVSSMRVLSAYNPVSLAVNVARENLFATVGYAYPPEVYLLGLLAWAVVLIGSALVVATRQLRTKCASLSGRRPARRAGRYPF